MSERLYRIVYQYDDGTVTEGFTMWPWDALLAVVRRQLREYDTMRSLRIFMRKPVLVERVQP